MAPVFFCQWWNTGQIRATIRQTGRGEAMLHIIFVDNFPFAYAYTVLLVLVSWGRFRRDLDLLCA